MFKTNTPDGNVITNIYNAEGLRVEKTVNGLTTRYLYEYSKVVLELDGSGNQKARNIYGTNLLVRQMEQDIMYYMYNGHADVTALINGNGVIVGSYYYDAFGNVIEESGSVDNPYRYSGYQYDEETGLYYLNARMYDPMIARFLQEDTYRGEVNDPLSLNLYTYCANEPLMYSDPDGHKRSTVQIGEAKFKSGDTTNGVTSLDYSELVEKLYSIPCIEKDEFLNEFVYKGKDGKKRVSVRKMLRKFNLEDTISWWNDGEEVMNVLVRPETKNAPVKVTRAGKNINVNAFVHFENATSEEKAALKMGFYAWDSDRHTNIPYNRYNRKNYQIGKNDYVKVNVTIHEYNKESNTFTNYNKNNKFQQHFDVVVNRSYDDVPTTHKIPKLRDHTEAYGYTENQNWHINDNNGKVYINKFQLIKNYGERQVMGHEFGHKLGIGEAYGDEAISVGTINDVQYEKLGYRLTGTIMTNDFSGNYVNDFDVALMWEAYKTNRYQDPFDYNRSMV